MKKVEDYKIAYKGLVDGEYQYSFNVKDSFFEDNEENEIEGADISVSVLLNKKSTHIELSFDIDGKVGLPCDRCLEIFENKIEKHQTIYIKFGEEYIEEDENLYILPETDNDINLEPFINELILVALPYRRVHKEDKNGNSTCSEGMLKYIKNVKKEGSEIDPRWNELNKLKDGTS